MGGLYYTLFPELVDFAEANATCSQMANGSLAILNTYAAAAAVERHLLPTLPLEVRQNCSPQEATAFVVLHRPRDARRSGEERCRNLQQDVMICNIKQ
jgi:hypothetical protein